MTMLWIAIALLAFHVFLQLSINRNLLRTNDTHLDLIKGLDHRLRWLEGHQDRVIDAEIVENDNHNFRS